MKGVSSLALVMLLVACSRPVMFRVESDEVINDGILTLNGHSARLMKNVDGAYWAKWNGADADGRITVSFPDGGHASCRVGYITNGMGTQQFAIANRQCVQVLD